MAIKFVDIEPEDGKSRKADASRAKASAENEKGGEGPEAADGELPLSGLAHAKPVPKKRGRK